MWLWADAATVCKRSAVLFYVCISLARGLQQGPLFCFRRQCYPPAPPANYIQSATLEEVAAGKAWVFCLAAALSCPSFTDSRMPPSQLTEPLSQMSDSAACRSYSSCHITSLINSSLSVHMQSTKLMNHTFKRQIHQPVATITWVWCMLYEYTLKCLFLSIKII